VSAQDLFPLKETTVSVRGKQCRVRELSHQKRAEISKLIVEDKFRGPALWASTCCIEPQFTEEQAAQLPAEVIDVLAKEGMRLCGINLDDDDKATQAEGEPVKS